jgi:hypothetical protein
LDNLRVFKNADLTSVENVEYDQTISMGSFHQSRKDKEAAYSATWTATNRHSRKEGAYTCGMDGYEMQRTRGKKVEHIINPWLIPYKACG